MQFFTGNWVYTPNCGLKIRIFLRFTSPSPPHTHLCKNPSVCTPFSKVCIQSVSQLFVLLRYCLILTVQGGCIHGSPSICMGNRFLVLKVITKHPHACQIGLKKIFLFFSSTEIISEPHCEKTCLMPYANNKDVQISLRIRAVWSASLLFVAKIVLELVFRKHYAHNSLPLPVNSHHVLFVKRLPKFSKSNNSEKITWIFF